MSSIARIGFSAVSRVGQICSRTTPIMISKRACGWNIHYKPGPYPKTKEEREAAAKKYNLIPEDYEPYPEGSGFGDYPKLQPVGEDSRDPYEDFDYYHRRRNFGETYHVDYDTHMFDKHNPNIVYRYSIPFMLACFTGFVATFVLIAGIDRYFGFRTHHPMKPQQMPQKGVVHYTFEPLN